jgi:hypothetical protein
MDGLTFIKLEIDIDEKLDSSDILSSNSFMSCFIDKINILYIERGGGMIVLIGVCAPFSNVPHR